VNRVRRLRGTDGSFLNRVSTVGGGSGRRNDATRRPKQALDHAARDEGLRLTEMISETRASKHDSPQ
jgi:hypothetical protein